MLDIEEDIRSLQLDSVGVCISKEEYLKSKQKVEEKSKEKEIEWGKGLAQKREAEAQLKELEIEKHKLLHATGFLIEKESFELFMLVAGVIICSQLLVLMAFLPVVLDLVMQL
ncbi:hypothetical protein HN51_070792 [Arachis hypogaea]|uniref:uncharacterized protein isoform X2 n=1 Tax=Arachis hypogaea TaxID=3818 RepID=UPI003B21D89D|nr:Pre-mRNA-splicing factor of RES complex protein [Arachis hypogaea]